MRLDLLSLASTLLSVVSAATPDFLSKIPVGAVSIASLLNEKGDLNPHLGAMWPEQRQYRQRGQLV